MSGLSAEKGSFDSINNDEQSKGFVQRNDRIAAKFDFFQKDVNSD